MRNFVFIGPKNVDLKSEINKILVSLPEKHDAVEPMSGTASDDRHEDVGQRQHLGTECLIGQRVVDE